MKNPRNFNRTAKLAFFNARRDKRDARLISIATKTPSRSVYGMLSAGMRISDRVANVAYDMSKHRVKNSEVA